MKLFSCNRKFKLGYKLRKVVLITGNICLLLLSGCTTVDSNNVTESTQEIEFEVESEFISESDLDSMTELETRKPYGPGTGVERPELQTVSQESESK